MDNRLSAIEIIEKRTSIRAFSDRPVERDLADELLRRAREHNQGPFGSSVRFQIVNVSESDNQELRSLGVHVWIRGATTYLAGFVRRAPQALVDFGYCMEAAILAATELGLGTCWVAGLNRTKFGELLNLAEDEIVPAVTPLGYPGEKGSPLVTLLGTKRGNRRRKPAVELFFLGKPGVSLDMAKAGPYQKVLECVRQAPSASNGQPWRIVREPDRNVYHLLLRENRLKNNILGEIKIQHMDMGIAMCHFELAARELNLKGSWKTEPVIQESLQHIATWFGEQELQATY